MRKKFVMQGVVRGMCGAVALLVSGLTMSGCGQITDKDRIVIAELNGEPITRGDLRHLIRDMDDDKRPIIKRKGDLLRVLNGHLDNTILDNLAYDLRTERKIEVTRDRAREVHFQRVPDDRTTWEVSSAEELAAHDIDVSEGQLTAFKADIEFKVDDVEQELLREEALNHLVREALQSGEVTISDEEFQAEYKIYKDRLFFFERISFYGLRFLSDFEDSAKAAAEARKRIDDGEEFDEVVSFYVGINSMLAVSSVMENNPALGRFRQFWQKASGVQAGDVLGPVFVPDYQLMERLPDGTIKTAAQPSAHLVVKVTEAIPPKEKSWEEARADLAPMILRRKMFQRLRDENGVKVYEDRLPDPGLYEQKIDGDFVDASF